MSKKTPITQPKECWAPTCDNKFDLNKKFYSLLSNPPKLRETWLALSTKPKGETPENEIFFCQNHFKANGMGFTIDNIFYSQLQMVTIPNNNMPDRVCRICNDFMDVKEPMYTMSKCFSLEVPHSVQTELKNLMVTINPEPLYQIFKFCFTNFVLPTDPVPLICSKCYVNIWLFFAYKKRAIEVEEILSQGFTPEEYGNSVLCRTCSVERCSNFINLDKDVMGSLLQNMFVKNFSPDVVPLRICVTCHNTLESIYKFHRQYLNTEKIIKRRALLNSKFQSSAPNHLMPSICKPPTMKDEQKKFEKENIILAKLMLLYGQDLKNNLHNIEHWKPICQKLEEQGINHNVPSLINNWKKLQHVTHKKLLEGVTLSKLENIVLKYDTNDIRFTIRPDLELIPVNNGTQNIENTTSTSKSMNKDEDIRCIFIGSPKELEISTEFSIQEKSELVNIMRDYKIENNMPGDPSLNDNIWTEIVGMLKDKGITKTVESVKTVWNIMKENALKAKSEKKTLDEVDLKLIKLLEKKQGRKKLNIDSKIRLQIPKKRRSKLRKARGPVRAASFSEKMDLLKALRIEFDKTTPEERKKKSIWSDLIKSVNKNHLPHIPYIKLSNLFCRLKMSAKTHEKDGSDIFDMEIWKMLEQVQKEKMSPTKDSKIVEQSRQELNEIPSTSTASLTNDSRTTFDKRSLEIKITNVSPNQKVPNTTLESKPKKTKSISPNCCSDSGTPKTNGNKLNEIASTSTASLTNNSRTTSHKRSLENEITNVSLSQKIPGTTPESKPKKTKGVSPNCCSESCNVIIESMSGLKPLAIKERKLFMKMKETFKELKRSGEQLENAHIWKLIFTKIYQQEFDIDRKQAEHLWHNIRSKVSMESLKKKSNNEFSQEVYRFLQKVRLYRESFLKAYKANSVMNKKIKPQTSQPSNKIQNENKTPHMTEKSEIVNSPRQLTTMNWTEEEKDVFLLLLSQQIHSNFKIDWAELYASFTLKGFNRSYNSLRTQWRIMRKRVMDKINREERLGEAEIQILNLVHKVREHQNTNTSYKVNEIENNDAMIIEPEQVKTVQPKIYQNDPPCVTVDLTYDYVSLEDLRLSTTWDMPTLKPMTDERNEKMNFVLTKVEGGDDAYTSSSKSDVLEEGMESAEDIINQSYVGAKDLEIVNIESEEEEEAQ